MLILSYIVAAALELALVLLAAQTNQSGLVWAYGFLLFSSIVSIPAETSELAKQIRSDMREAGICLACYDILSNVLRSVVYEAVLFVALNPSHGALLAYGIAILSLLLALHKMR